MASKIDLFFESFNAELSDSKESLPWKQDIDCFTDLMIQYLKEVDESDDPIIFSYRDSGIQVNAYEFSSDNTRLNIYVSIYTPSNSLISVSKTDVISAFQRGSNIYKKVSVGKTNSFQKDQDMYDFIQQIEKKKTTIVDVNIVVLTNGLVKDCPTSDVKIGNVTLRYNIWDIERLAKRVFSGHEREPIDLDLNKYLGKPLTVLEGGESDEAKVYLAVLPGTFLVHIYQEYRDKLLERNVRAYLQRKGEVNKGIINTIQNQPDMFLAYNNGITVTASSVEIDENYNHVGNEIRIKKINDFQIVNGGQTTVSLYLAFNDKNFESDFSKVYVQMKLTVVRDESGFDDIVPNISRFSNLQNKVQSADFASNDPFHREMENLSRNIWTPSTNGRKPIQWFFERARGQYASALNAEPTPSKRKEFKLFHPLVTKTDIAKVLLSWEEKPSIVALGAQKAFAKFMNEIKDGTKFIPDQEYFKHTIGKTILFRNIEKIVMQQKFGGYKADIVAYTFYKLMLLTERRVNIEEIWNQQSISNAMVKQIVLIARKVQAYIVSAESGANVSEFCKSKRCVEGVANLPVELNDDLRKELVDKEQIDNFNAKYTENALNKDEIEIIEKVWSVSLNEWLNMANWARDNHLFDYETRNDLFQMASLKKRGKKILSSSFATKVSEIYQMCIDRGFKL